MTYERDDYMRRQEADHDLIRMRTRPSGPPKLYPHEALLKSQRDAAPELYAALSKLVMRWDGIPEANCASEVRQARAALAKARGQ